MRQKMVAQAGTSVHTKRAASKGHRPAASSTLPCPSDVSRELSRALWVTRQLKQASVDGRNPAPEKPWNDDSPVNTSKPLWFPMVCKWRRISSIRGIWIYREPFNSRRKNCSRQVPTSHGAGSSFACKHPSWDILTLCVGREKNRVACGNSRSPRKNG